MRFSARAREDSPRELRSDVCLESRSGSTCYPYMYDLSYLLRVKSLFIGVLRSNLSTARPFPRVHCRPVPLSKPHAEALLTR